MQVIKKTTISVSVVNNEQPATATATLMPVQESADTCIKVESPVTPQPAAPATTLVTPQQAVPAATLVTAATTVVTTSSSG